MAYQIPFKTKLSEPQKDSIRNLLSNKPDPSTWTKIDIGNWNYATGNAALPKKQSSAPLPSPIVPVGQKNAAVIKSGNNYQLIEAGGFGLTAGIRSISGTTIPQNVPIIDITNETNYVDLPSGMAIPQKVLDFNPDFRAAWGTGKANIADADIANIVGQYEQNKRAGVSQTAGAPPVSISPPSGESGGVPAENFTDYSKLPDDIKNNPLFKKLSNDQRVLFAFNYNIMRRESAIENIRAIKALKKATELAEPKFKQDLLLATDEFERGLSKLLASNDDERKKLELALDIKKQDLVKNFDRFTESQREEALRDIESIAVIKEQASREGASREAGVLAEISRIQRRISAIDEDLKYNKEQLSLEEQASLARSMREYQRNLQAKQEQAIDTGIGYSSMRIEADRRLTEDLADVTESTKRQKMRERRALETEAGRDTKELIMNQQEIERKNQELRVGLAREMELKIGYDALPTDIKKYLPEPIKVDSTGAPVRSEAERRQVEREIELRQKQEDIKTAEKRAEAETLRQQKILERERMQGVQMIERAREEIIGSTGRAGELGGIQGTLEREKLKGALQTREALMPETSVTKEELQEELKKEEL